MERKLASIQRVVRIEPIINADAIEVARINGWQCVTKKGEFKAGDLGVFLEIDSIPPDTKTFNFLWQPRAKDGETANEIVARPDNFRIRTMKLRGVLSQGLLLPLNQFELGNVREGDDVTAKLGIEKYEPPIPQGMGEYRAQFPNFIPKTDETRVQSEPRVLDELRGSPYVVTLKYDGTSATFVIDPRDDSFHVCSRNFSLLDGQNFYWNVARRTKIEEVLRQYPHLAIQGEVCGPGIQKNRLALKQVSLFVFNIYDRAQSRFFDHEEGRQFASENGLDVVEEVERGDNFAHTQETLLALAEGKYEGTSNEREGIVIRPLHECRSEILAGRLSFKAISNRFLLKESD